MNKQTINVVFYAINGTGLGHITRFNNIAEDAQIICSEMGMSPNFQFLTTSDAPSVVSKFLTTKFPSKTTIKSLELPVRKTTALIKTQISNFIALHSPDCLVLDTNPRGSYNEFSYLKSLAKSSLFIDRHKKPEAITNTIKKTLKLYDTVIVPETDETVSSFSFHPNCYHVGKIHGFKPEKSLSRAEARKTYDVSDGRLLIYLSSGGGGDKCSQEVLNKWIATITKTLPAAKVVIGYGPLYSGTVLYGRPSIIPFTSAAVSNTFNGFDLAISAAGYNSCEELLAARVPTLFYGLEKGLDDQILRIEQYAEQGYCLSTRNIGDSGTIIALINNQAAIRKCLSHRKQHFGSIYTAMHIIRNSLISKNGCFDEGLGNEIMDSIISTRKQAIIANTASIAA